MLLACFTLPLACFTLPLARALDVDRSGGVGRGKLGRACSWTAGRGDLGRGTGADGLRVPATRVLPGHVLAAPSVLKDRVVSPTVDVPTERPRGRLRANPGSSRCFPRSSAPVPRADTVGAPLVARRRLSRWRAWPSVRAGWQVPTQPVQSQWLVPRYARPALRSHASSGCLPAFASRLPAFGNRGPTCSGHARGSQAALRSPVTHPYLFTSMSSRAPRMSGRPVRSTFEARPWFLCLFVQ